ncbi:hypothetical protein DRE_07750 [Drechslerella stenobrocha 248]|uniref:Eukaryotic translation initiation factor 4E type 2 n=1 Tax=Drechslerella stenobrocha 248 TaxID=1043628 RepID=W7I880_9PEZI|nr:hypothetical protein DRE_07750 [Drechslerella stenobrocha 248]
MSSTLWNRRTTPGKLTLTVSNPDGSSNSNDNSSPSSARGFGPAKGRGAASRDGISRFDPLSAVGPLSAGGSFSTLASPSTAFSLGSGAFASFGSSAKTPTKPTADPIASAATAKEPGPGPAPTSSTAVTPGLTGRRRQPKEGARRIHEFQDYEKSTQKIAAFSTVEEFWMVYSHLRKPRSLPHVSDYHLFKQGIRPVWEDSENRKGGKWIIRLKKGVSTRYWEDLVLAIIGDQFGETGEDICGAVLSIRNAEDVLSIWTRVNNATTLKIRETIKRVLALPVETIILFKTHDESIAHERNIHQNQVQLPTPVPNHRHQGGQYGKQDRQPNKNPNHQANNNGNGNGNGNYHQQTQPSEKRD